MHHSFYVDAWATPNSIMSKQSFPSISVYWCRYNVYSDSSKTYSPWDSFFFLFSFLPMTSRAIVDQLVGSFRFYFIFFRLWFDCHHDHDHHHQLMMMIMRMARDLACMPCEHIYTMIAQFSPWYWRWNCFEPHTRTWTKEDGLIIQDSICSSCSVCVCCISTIFLSLLLNVPVGLKIIGIQRSSHTPYSRMYRYNDDTRTHINTMAIVCLMTITSTHAVYDDFFFSGTDRNNLLWYKMEQINKARCLSAAFFRL